MKVAKVRSEGALLWFCDASKVMSGLQEANQARLLLKQSKERMRRTLRESEWSW